MLDRLIALRGFRWGDDLAPAEQALLPEPADWVPARPLVDALVSALARAGAAPVLARTPVRLVDPAVLDESRADAVVAQRAAEAAAAIDAVLAVLVASSDGDGLTVDDADAIGQMHAVLAPLVQRDLGSAVTPRTAGRAPAAGRDGRVARGRGGRGRGATVPRSAGASRCPRPTRRPPWRSPGARRRRSWKFLDGGWRRVKRLVAAGLRRGRPRRSGRR